jgi:hypothetical protein
MAVYEPNNQGAKVSIDGRVAREKVWRVDVLVRYLDRQVPVTLDFVPARPEFAWTAPTPVTSSTNSSSRNYAVCGSTQAQCAMTRRSSGGFI